MRATKKIQAIITVAKCKWDVLIIIKYPLLLIGNN